VGSDFSEGLVVLGQEVALGAEASKLLADLSVPDDSLLDRTVHSADPVQTLEG